MANYSRDFNTTIKLDTEQRAMAKRFELMLTKLNRILKKNPIYTPWIKIQIGTDKKNTITFNTSSTKPNENLIVSLTNEKSGVDVANKLTVSVVYDAFKNGQDSNSQLDKFDELMANALNYSFSNDNTALLGYIQYGYNNTEDLDLVSPKYEVIFTNITSDTDWKTGFITYTFEGVSILSTLGNCTYTFGDFNIGDNSTKWGYGDLVLWHLYYFYGDPQNKPKHITANNVDVNSPKYKIDIPEELYKQMNTMQPAVPGIPDVTPWQYVRTMLDNNPVLPNDKVKDDVELPPNKKPRFNLYITDNDRTIHLNYYSPNNEQSIKLNHIFTWNDDNNSILIDWKNQVDLRMYILQKMQQQTNKEKYKQVTEEINKAQIQKAQLENELSIKGKTDPNLLFKVLAFNKRADDMNQKLSKAISAYSDNENVFETFNSSLTLVGIPANIPIGTIIKVIPKVLESKTRQEGQFMVLKATDRINSNGLFTTTLDLFRLGGLNEDVINRTVSSQNKVGSSIDKIIL